MNPDLHDRLRSIGFNPLVAQGLAQLESTGAPMRVTEVHRDSLLLHDGQRDVRAKLLPPLARALTGDQIAVGDWVLAEADNYGDLWITARMPPVTQLTRRASDGARQVLVSNVDSALLVMGLDGDHNLRRLERYLAMVQSAGVWPVVVLTKQDLVNSAADMIVELRQRVPADVAVHAVDARSAAAAQELRDYLGAGQTLVLLGSSGAGKSTLTNTLLG